MDVGHENRYIDEAVELLEKANADLSPELLSVPECKQALEAYAKARRLVDFGIAALAARVENPRQVARMTGTSMLKARETVATGKVAAESAVLGDALRHGDVSLDQACEIAKAEESAPGAVQQLVSVAQESSFQVLREKAKAVKLEAESHRDLAQRQREARRARSFLDELGMTHVHLVFQPHVGTPVVARAEAEAGRLFRAAKKAGTAEPFECYLADAFASMLEGSSVKGNSKRPELVVLVSHDVAERGWTEVCEGEICKAVASKENPGRRSVKDDNLPPTRKAFIRPGQITDPALTAKEIAARAFLNAVVCDGKDLREFKRWTRHIPVEIELALELGPAPEFDGIKCVKCGHRLGNQIDHIEPVAASGPTSHGNLGPRCDTCHPEKTARDRAAGKLKPRPRPDASRPSKKKPGKKPGKPPPDR